MTKKAVIYARYSCEKQTEQSIEGQLRVCNEFAERNGYTVIQNYIDRAVSHNAISKYRLYPCGIAFQTALTHTALDLLRKLGGIARMQRVCGKKRLYGYSKLYRPCRVGQNRQA